MTEVAIRFATLNDAESLADIYNHYVSNTWITFETKTIDAQEMERRIGDILRIPLPWLVAESSEKILGFAYAAPWKNRHAYRFSVESTIYLRPDEIFQGVGAKLYGALIDEIRSMSLQTVIGGIALPNEPSIQLHERFGFTKVGHFERVGFKLEQWIDVGYWQLSLDDRK